jgi:Tfp pilus assembly protein PilE
MIVSVALFSVVMLVATSAYLVMIKEDRRARATNDLVTSMSFAVDTMSRGLRTGTGYECGGNPPPGANCSAGLSSITFTNDQGNPVTYALTGTEVGQCTGASCTVTAFTDPRIIITNLKFFVRGVGTGDHVQPNVLFTMTGTMTPDPTTGPITFTIQSMASQRIIEVP